MYLKRKTKQEPKFAEHFSELKKKAQRERYNKYDFIKEKKSNYKKENREHCNEWSKEYYWKNHEKKRQQAKKCYYKHRVLKTRDEKVESGCGKLTDKQIKEIQDLRKQGVLQKDLARKYNTTTITIRYWTNKKARERIKKSNKNRVGGKK